MHDRTQWSVWSCPSRLTLPQESVRWAFQRVQGRYWCLSAAAVRTRWCSNTGNGSQQARPRSLQVQWGRSVGIDQETHGHRFLQKAGDSKAGCLDARCTDTEQGRSSSCARCIIVWYCIRRSLRAEPHRRRVRLRALTSLSSNAFISEGAFVWTGSSCTGLACGRLVAA